MLHVSAAPFDTTYGALHVGEHDTPDAMLDPSPHIAAFITTGSMQGLGVHVNVVGVSVPAEHDSVMLAEMVYPATHVGEHDPPEATLPPDPHVAEFDTVGKAQASGEHDGGDPDHVPPSWQ